MKRAKVYSHTPSTIENEKVWLGETLMLQIIDKDNGIITRAEWWGKKPPRFRTGTWNIQYHATDVEFKGFDERGDRTYRDIENPLPWSATVYYTNKRCTYACQGYAKTEQEAKDIAEAKYIKLLQALIAGEGHLTGLYDKETSEPLHVNSSIERCSDGTHM